MPASARRVVVPRGVALAALVLLPRDASAPSASSTCASANTCGCRRTILSLIAATTSPKSNAPCSSAMRAWNTTCSSRSPSSSAAPAGPCGRSRRRLRRLPRSCTARWWRRSARTSHGQPPCGSRRRAMIASRRVDRCGGVWLMPSQPLAPRQLRIAEREEIAVEQRVALVVAQRPALRVEHHAAGGFQHASARRPCPIRWSGRSADTRPARLRRAGRTSATNPGPAVRSRPCVAMKASVRASRCERLAATRSGAVAGRRALRIAHRRSPSRRNAPRPPRVACHSSPVTGACTMPKTATPSSISAMLTVNSPLRLTNSRVPSSGSTSHRRRHSRRMFQVVSSRGLLRQHRDVGRQRFEAVDDGCGARPGRRRSAASVGLVLDGEVAVVDARGSRAAASRASAIAPSRSGIVDLHASIRSPACAAIRAR